MDETRAPALLFAGPSTHGLVPGLIDAAGVQLLPPVRRGDVERLAQTSSPGVLIVCDGVFQSAPAVSHAELCAAIDGGWSVWGCSSIGAIRAHELRSEGMQGFGRVHAMFQQFDDFTDDELCLLHFPEPPWFPVSEPLVNLRHALASQGPAMGIADDAAQTVLASLRAMWFGDRTTDRIRGMLCTEGACSPQQADALLTWLASNRVKALDLQALLTNRPWQTTVRRTP